MTYSLFWDVPQYRLAVSYLRFEKTLGSVFKILMCAWALKMGPIDRPETSVTTNIRWVTTQKSEDLISF